MWQPHLAKIEPSQNGCFAVRLIHEIHIPLGHGILVESYVNMTKIYESFKGLVETDPQLLPAAIVLVPRSSIKYVMFEFTAKDMIRQKLWMMVMDVCRVQVIVTLNRMFIYEWCVFILNRLN